MKDEEYAEWSKIKFQITQIAGGYGIRSVDFPAIPIGGVFPYTTSLPTAKRIILKKLNKFNKKLRWTNKTVGDKSIVKKHKTSSKHICYSFHNNVLDDLEFLGVEDFLKYTTGNDKKDNSNEGKDS